MTEQPSGAGTTAVIVVGHAGYAQGAVEGAQMILGERKDLHAIGMQPDQEPDEVVDQVRAIAEPVFDGDGGTVLLLADLFGGSPANAVAAAFLRDPRVHLVTGVNLPMLLETLIRSGSAGASGDDLVQTAVQAGTQGVIDAGSRLRPSSPPD